MEPRLLHNNKSEKKNQICPQFIEPKEIQQKI